MFFVIMFHICDLLYKQYRYSSVVLYADYKLIYYHLSIICRGRISKHYKPNKYAQKYFKYA